MHICSTKGRWLKNAIDQFAQTLMKFVTENDTPFWLVAVGGTNFVNSSLPGLNGRPFAGDGGGWVGVGGGGGERWVKAALACK